ncbi:unnamed protein product [Moneuplotes crassus]|uniref:EamA domain-containing protein n=1 Tax=Euplotes crassus TaxID=5936 RepID=A0AAD2CY31_EUPCR|nr:unnamed protein product [Moneuplotes crassus]
MYQETKSESEYKKIDIEETKEAGQKKIVSHNSPESNLWIYIALLASIFFAVSSFFIGDISSSGVRARVFLGIGNAIGSIIYFIVDRKTNEADGQGDSFGYFYDENGKLRRSVVLIVITDVILLILGGFAIVFAFEYCLYADLNQGILTTMFSFGSVFTLILAYFIFNEKTKVYHLIGVALLIACAALISLSGQRTKDNFVIVEGELVEKSSKIVPISIGILCSAYFTLRTLYLKQYNKKYNVRPVDFISLTTCIAGVILLVPAILIILLEGVSLKFCLYSVIGGVLQIFGGFCAYYATTHGLAGPAAAITIIQVPIQTLLDVFLLNQIPVALEVGGGLCGVIGALTIALGQSIYNVLKNDKDQ